MAVIEVAEFIERERQIGGQENKTNRLFVVFFFFFFVLQVAVTFIACTRRKKEGVTSDPLGFFLTPAAVTRGSSLAL